MKNPVLAITATFLALSLNAGFIREFNQQHAEKEISTQQLISFLRNHQDDPLLCSSIQLDLTVWHDEDYNQTLFNSVHKKFCDLAEVCQRHENNKDDMSWIDILGSPFKDMFDLVDENNNIHGNVSLQNDDNNNFCVRIMVNHDDQYDHERWKQIIHISIDYLEKCTVDEVHPTYECLGPIFHDTITLTAGDKTIHALLKATWNDGDDVVHSWYSQ